MSRKRLAAGAAARCIAGFAALSLLFFLPAGTLAYWEAWAYLATLFVPMIFVLAWLVRNDPASLERRLRYRERERAQKLIMGISYIQFLATFCLPGFDRRFGWSDAPAAMVIAADALVLVGYGIFFLTIRENRYASRTIEVERAQPVVSSGPYALVRHPMYSGITLLLLLSPLALGSYWAMIPSLCIVPIIVARIRNEESVLARDLAGYVDYMRAVRFRLVPGLW